MSETKKSYQPTCEDYPEDDQAPAAQPKTTSKRAHSKPPPSTRTTSAPDTASIDSGYSSKTAATQDSGESGGASTKTLHPIKSNAPAAASLAHSRSASSDARRHSTSSTPTTKPDHSPTKTQQQKHIPPPVYAAPHIATALAHVPQPMASHPPCNCAKCVYKAHQHAAPRYSPLETQMDIHYPPFTQRQDAPLPSPTGPYPPSSYAAQPRRRLTSTRPRPVTFHEQWAPPPPPAASGPADHYHINPSHHFLPPSAPHAPHHVVQRPMRRPSTTAPSAASVYAPPPYAHGQPHMLPPSPQGPTRPHLTHYDTDGAAHSGAMVPHMYSGVPRSQAGFLQQPHYSRMRRSTSPGSLGPRDDRLMPPPPVPLRVTTAGPVRSASTRRPSPSYEYYDETYYPHEYDDGYEDGEADYGDEDWDRTIRPRRPDSSRPTILGSRDQHHYSTTSVPQRTSNEISRGRRRSSVGHRGLERDRLTDAEAHIAQTSTRTKDALTAEHVKKINSDSLASSSRSHRSRGGSERDGASSHISRGEASTKFRVNPDQSFEMEGSGKVRVEPRDDGNTVYIVETTGGQQVKYHKDGSRASRASHTSNKSRTSRASKSARPGEPIQEARHTSGSDKAARRKTKAEKPEVVLEDGEAQG